MNERDLEQYRHKLVTKYQDILEQDRRVLTDAEYQKFLKRQAEIQEIEMQIKKLEFKLEMLTERLLYLKEA